MPIDIIIFAAIAAVLVYRLNSVLGTRHGGERERDNPLTPQEIKTETLVPHPKPAAAAPLVLTNFETVIDKDANKDGRIETGLTEIAAADLGFEVNSFMSGAQDAFEMIVTAYANGDVHILEPLLSPKLFKDFKAVIDQREKDGHKSDVIIHRIKAARIIEAHLGGTMAYVTVDFDVEETTSTRDAGGNVIDGDPDRIFSIRDIWTFTRDTRADDPNWILIETRAADA